MDEIIDLLVHEQGLGYSDINITDNHEKSLVWSVIGDKDKLENSRIGIALSEKVELSKTTQEIMLACRDYLNWLKKNETDQIRYIQALVNRYGNIPIGSLNPNSARDLPLVLDYFAIDQSRGVIRKYVIQSVKTIAEDLVQTFENLKYAYDLCNILMYTEDSAYILLFIACVKALQGNLERMKYFLQKSRETFLLLENQELHNLVPATISNSDVIEEWLNRYKFQ